MFNPQGVPVILVLGRCRQADPWGFMVSQSRLIGKPHLNGRSYLQKQYGIIPRTGKHLHT